jgi:glycosyltransferase involved in cell wall biosynthesis
MLQRTPDLSGHCPDVSRRWDVEFSCALENKTGKYFIGRDLVRDQGNLINQVYYWRRGTYHLPGPFLERMLGLGMRIEVRAAGAAGRLPFPMRRPNRPTLHLDPHSVMHTALSERDIILCHDLGPITHPALFSPWVSRLYQRAYRRIARAAPRMVFVSRHSQREFTRLYGETADMRVIYPPLRVEMDGATATPIAGLDRQFLLTVGSLGARKNQAAMIHAFARSRLAERGIAYVLCGAREPGAEAIERLARQTPGVRLLDYVSDAELVWLYANASGFVLVSRLEGFGVPVAEAISRGLVPLITRDSVLEEVAGTGAIVVASDDLDAIAKGMVDLVAMPEAERRTRLARMQASLVRFSRPAFATAWRQMLEPRSVSRSGGLA